MSRVKTNSGIKKVPVHSVMDLISYFLGDKSDNTRRVYQSDLKDFTRYMKLPAIEIALTTLLSYAPTQAELTVLHYLSSMREKDLSPITINRRLSTLRSFVKTAYYVGMVSWRLDIKNSLPPSPLPKRSISSKQKKKVLSELRRTPDTPSSIRNYAILRLIIDLAFTRSEIVDLNLEDVEIKNGRIWVFRNRRRSSRRLPKLSLIALNAWVNIRGLDPGPLFINFDHAGKGTGLGATSVYRIIRQLGDSVGVAVTPKLLRATSSHNEA